MLLFLKKNSTFFSLFFSPYALDRLIYFRLKNDDLANIALIK